MPMTKEERAAYMKAYRAKNKEKMKAYEKKYYAEHPERQEKLSEASKKKLKEETPEQRAARLEKQRAYNKQYYAAIKAKKAAKKAEAEPKPEPPKPEPKPEPKPKPAKTRAGFLKKAEGETAEEAKARVAHNKAHFKKLRDAKAEREKADAEARARAEAADMEAREREKETRAKVLAKGKEEAAPAVRPVEIPDEEPEPRTTEGLPKPEPKPEPPAPEPPKPVKVDKRKAAAEERKEAKRQEGIKELEQMVLDLESGKRRHTESSTRYFDKRRRELGLPKSFYSDVTGKKTVTTSGMASPERMKEIERDLRVDRARAMIAAGGGGAMLPMIAGFA